MLVDFSIRLHPPKFNEKKPKNDGLDNVSPDSNMAIVG